MSTEQIQGGALFAVVAERTVSGVLLPWGEESRQSVTSAPITFPRGSIKIPRDVSIVSANVEHDRFTPVARATSIEDSEQGLVAEFRVADTDEGDELLEAISSGKLSKLSAEVKGIVRNGALAVSAILTGAAFTANGAFAGAGLFAIAVDPADITARLEALQAELADLTEAVAALPAVDTPEASETPETSDETPASEDEEITESEADEAEEKKNKGKFTMANATVPNTLSDSASEPTVDRSKTGLFELIKAARNMDPGAVAELQAAQNTSMFALADIKYSGTNALGTGVVQPAWVGELWSGRSFERKIIPLLSTGVLTSMTEKGYRWTTKPEVAQYLGNKAEVPTNSPTTSAYSVDAVRFAGAWDLDRAFYDLGETEVLNSFFSHMVNSYAAKTDAYALTQVLAAASSSVSEAYPTGVNVGMGRIVQGALNVITAGGTPTSAIVAPDVYKQLIFTREDDKLAFLSTAIGLEAGSLESFRVVPHAGLATGNVLVLDKNAATFKELGSGIRVNALDVARAGVDEAIYGYALVKVDLPAAIQRVTPAA
jgi:hypothetical protein